MTLPRRTQQTVQSTVACVRTYPTRFQQNAQQQQETVEGARPPQIQAGTGRELGRWVGGKEERQAERETTSAHIQEDEEETGHRCGPHSAQGQERDRDMGGGHGMKLDRTVGDETQLWRMEKLIHCRNQSHQLSTVKWGTG